MKYIKEELEQLIHKENLSYREIGRRYNVSDTYIKKVANKLGITLKVRSKFPDGFVPANKLKIKYNPTTCRYCGNPLDYYSKKFCNITCQGQHYHDLSYKAYLLDSTIVTYDTIRKFKKDFLKEQNCKCDICQISNLWNNKPITFVLDHIDGNAGNNNRINLRLICPNCDSQLDTYKSKNKNSARKERYLKSKK